MMVAPEERVKAKTAKGAVGEELEWTPCGRSPSGTLTLAQSHGPEWCTCGAAVKLTAERYLIAQTTTYFKIRINNL